MAAHIRELRPIILSARSLWQPVQGRPIRTLTNSVCSNTAVLSCASESKFTADESPWYRSTSRRDWSSGLACMSILRKFSQSACMQRTLRIHPASTVNKIKKRQHNEIQESTDKQEAINQDEGPHGSVSPGSQTPSSHAVSDAALDDVGFTGTHRIKGSSDINRKQSQKRSPVADMPSKSKVHDNSPERIPSWKGHGKVQSREMPVLKSDRFDSGEKSKKSARMRTVRDTPPSGWRDTVSADLLDVCSEKGKRKSRKVKMTNNVKDKNHRMAEQPSPSRGNDLLFGISPCLLAIQLQRREIHQVFVTTAFQNSHRSEVTQLLAIMEERGLRVQTTTRGVLEKLCGYRPHQGICMETSRLYFNTLNAEDISPGASVRLLLDQIKDPMNLGALLRSAYFLGVDRVIVSKKNCCSLTPVVSKASSGVMEVLPVYATKDVPSFLQEEQARGWSIVGASLSGRDAGSNVIPCHEYNRVSPIILVVGNEGFGLSSDIKGICSEFISVPAGRELHPGIDSLNVSVATGILLNSLLGR